MGRNPEQESPAKAGARVEGPMAAWASLRTDFFPKAGSDDAGRSKILLSRRQIFYLGFFWLSCG